MDKISNPAVQQADKLRLALLYVIRYESFDESATIRRALVDNGVPSQEARFVDLILSYAGETRRAQGLFSAGGFISKYKIFFINFQCSLNYALNYAL